MVRQQFVKTRSAKIMIIESTIQFAKPKCLERKFLSKWFQACGHCVHVFAKALRLILPNEETLTHIDSARRVVRTPIFGGRDFHKALIGFSQLA